MNRQQTKTIYAIGAHCWQLSLLLRGQNLKIFRSLKELVPELKVLGQTGALSLHASKIHEASTKYVNNIASGHGVVEHASKEALEQFAQSGEYVKRWIDVLHDVPASKHEALDTDIKKAVEKHLGSAQQTPDSKLMAWVAEQKQSGVKSINIDTLFNKIVHLNKEQ